MRSSRALAALVCAVAALGVAAAAATSRTVPIAFARAETAPRDAAAASIEVRSSAFPNGGTIPLMFSAYGRNLSPPLSWSGVPDNAKSLALIVEDPDAPGPQPVLHWIAWNIPPDVDRLTRNVRIGPEPPRPGGMRQGWNFHDSIGYTGPRPPIGDPPHRYHVQVYALDRMLGLGGGAHRDDLLRAMSGHVLARGELVGLYAQAPPRAPRR